MEQRMEMQNKVEQTTKMYTRVHGMIQCNRGEQERQVRELLETHGYTVDELNRKKSRATLLYLKKEGA